MHSSTNENVLRLLRETALLADLPEAELRALAERMEFRSVPTGTSVVNEGEPGDEWFVIVRGTVEVLTHDLVGQAKVLTTLGAAEAFGEIALIRDGRRTATVRACEEVLLLSLHRDAFAEFARAHPAFGEELRVRADRQEIATFLRRASPLASLPSNVLYELAAQVERVPVASNVTIVREAEPGDRLYLIRSGRVEVVARGRHVGYLGEGDCFGEVALLGAGKRTATVRAVTDTQLLALSRAAFHDVVGADAEVAGRLAELARIRHRVAAIPRPAVADVLSRLSPALERRRGAWLVLVLGTAAFAVLSALAVRVDVPVLATLTVLVGALVGPLAFCAFLAEANILTHRWTTLGVAFGLAAGVGVPLAVTAERWLGLEPGPLRVGVVGALIEEPLKLVGVVWLVRRASSRFIFDGVIYGAAAGMGFAAFESVLYGLGRAEDVSHLLGTLWARTLLAPFGHGTWTAIMCGAIWALKTHARWRWDIRIIGAMSLAVGLHALWDWQLLPGGLHIVWLLGVGLIGLAVLGIVLHQAAAEEAGAILALNPELTSANPTVTSLARVSCQACGQAAPRGAHYCPRCGRALRLDAQHAT